VFLTVHEDFDFVEAARNAGAHGYVLKRAIASDLLPTIRAVLNGCCAFPDVWRMAAHQARSWTPPYVKS
jgi:DNA-binding NarL/FixJ family response regulator